VYQFEDILRKERQGAKAQRFSWRLNYFAPLREIKRKIVSDFKLIYCQRAGAPHGENW
jgi:hypothetical protein